MGLSDAVEDTVYSHSLWADNIICFSKSKEEFELMVSQLTSAIHIDSMDWTDSSLEYLVINAKEDYGDITFPFAEKF